MKKAACLLILFIVITLAMAQDFTGKPTPFTKNDLIQPQGNSLLDPARFTMNQSYSMSYATNGAQSDMTGLYLNRMQYAFKVPLTLQVDVGFFHKPMALSGESDLPSGAKNAVLTIPHVGLTYQPSKNFIMSFEYFNSPAGYGNAVNPYGAYNAFGSPFFSPLLPSRVPTAASHP
ncbi:MAG: hypothetical protein V1913_06650 [Fibrobacterota bacterium]